MDKTLIASEKRDWESYTGGDGSRAPSRATYDALVRRGLIAVGGSGRYEVRS